MTVLKIKTDEMMEYMRDVGEALLQQEEFKQLRKMVEDFSQDEEAQKLYEQFTNEQIQLQQKEYDGVELTKEEIEKYESDEEELYCNDKIRRFLFAQQEFSKVHELISQYIIKTIELNRLPERREIKIDRSCGCGGACGGH